MLSLPRVADTGAIKLTNSPVATRTRSKSYQLHTLQQLPTPIVSRTRSKLQAYSSSELLTSKVLQQINLAFELQSFPSENTPQMIANSILDEGTGLMLEYCQLIHRKYLKSK